jgi:hypothetical protein
VIEGSDDLVDVGGLSVIDLNHRARRQ